MRLSSAFRESELARNIAGNIAKATTRRWNIMEFCGTHTVAIFRHGLKAMLPGYINLVSGPGCPVCVTSRNDIDRILYLADLPGTIVATYGDMMKVPGSGMSLSDKRARGADVRVVYSIMDAVGIARANPPARVIFNAVGFETTAPSTAAVVRGACSEGIDNFHILSLHKVTPPVVTALLDGGTEVDGFLCPGHVCSIIGSRPLEPVAAGYKKPCVIAGFEPADVLQGILMLVRQLEEARSEVEIEYSRGVRPEGNTNALAVMDEVFCRVPAEWRGIGEVDGTGLKLREEFAAFDAERFIDREIVSEPDPPGCQCGEVLRGEIVPTDCALFGSACNPENPVGPCMVSSEGSCATYYQYAEKTRRQYEDRTGR
jgi:hydrogenase expression/formation protein HypD